MSYTSSTVAYNISGSGDEASFSSQEVSTLRFFSNDTARVDTWSDTNEFINPVLLRETAVLILDLLASLED